ncbi:hypothetical protein NC652_040141 [Populus alba x Populus x berolinensis]|nr:hypothetical protein NC652_040141 [Populus alba x Populus x berolinensis]
MPGFKRAAPAHKHQAQANRLGSNVVRRTQGRCKELGARDTHTYKGLALGSNTSFQILSKAGPLQEKMGFD